jgi:hypothetical protein
VAKPKCSETEALWRCLDRALEIYAVSCDVDAEVASFVMLTVLVLGERLALSDKALAMMLDSAVAEARRLCYGTGEPSLSDGGD